jgi:aspartyl-tRNA(Asn)/glutamyl-tRNA(Gln) amidotransferase subunit B
MTMFNQSTRSAYGAFARRPYICQACIRRARPGPWASTSYTSPPSTRYLHQVPDASPSPSPKDDAPFRKALKDAAKKKRAESKTSKNPSSSKSKSDPRLDKWELTVGIEIHAELNTRRKLFSSAATTSASEAPNSHVALFDVAFPGTQPCFQRETLVPAIRAALALGCEVQGRCSFDRKHYFYQDQPAGYQITQYYG